MTPEYQTRTSGNGSWAQPGGKPPGRIQPSERSIGELFSELATETRTLVQDEIALAKAELKANTAGVGAHAGKSVVGAALLYVSLLVFTATLVMVLATFMPDWVAGLIVAVIYAIVGSSMLKGGVRGLKQVSLTPTETIKTLQEDARWLKDQK